MKTSPDPRAAKTRQQIFDAVYRLNARDRSELTVADLVREAGLSRSSFYAHFSSIDEVALALLEKDVLQTAEDASRDGGLLPAHAAARLGYTRLIAHVTEHFAFYDRAVTAPATRHAYDESVAGYARRLVESMLELCEVPESVNREALATYVAGGALTLIRSWMLDQLDLTSDELVDQLVALLPSWLRESVS